MNKLPLSLLLLLYAAPALAKPVPEIPQDLSLEFFRYCVGEMTRNFVSLLFCVGGLTFGAYLFKARQRSQALAFLLLNVCGFLLLFITQSNFMRRFLVSCFTLPGAEDSLELTFAAAGMAYEVQIFLGCMCFVSNGTALASRLLTCGISGFKLFRGAFGSVIFFSAVLLGGVYSVGKGLIIASNPEAAAAYGAVDEALSYLPLYADPNFLLPAALSVISLVLICKRRLMAIFRLLLIMAAITLLIGLSISGIYALEEGKLGGSSFFLEPVFVLMNWLLIYINGAIGTVGLLTISFEFLSVRPWWVRLGLPLAFIVVTALMGRIFLPLCAVLYHSQ